ncbi:DNA polymerase IV [Alicyclobacillus fastidiosus]|uniref:DNA polymerase IV n=1 Tax=Alicyclobacillus fastidiosus TaxID=392011 RepID=A0ABV5ABF9_9BACL|nr:DNA polymerase IV [Alicyclobacillus fastidiosus]WEH10424.1 DNA polymerase IV [Alicyclobacillus fastidiosus]
MTSPRQILHVDMNAFYASCHAAQEPDKYANRPTAVAGSPETRHGIVVTASYEARRRGVKTTMTVQEAKRLCPDVVFILPDFALYRAYARRVFDAIRRFTPLVEIVSIDECYADVTGSRQFGDGLTIAKTIQDTIRDELHLPCSIGVADCKFFAKMGSNLKKPMGITVVNQTNFQRLLWPMAVEEIHGVGDKTAAKLHNVGIHTMEQLARASDRLLVHLFGTRGLELKQFVNGHDDRPVSSDRAPAKSIGHSITLPNDVADVESMKRVLLNLADQVGRRMRKHEVVGRVLTLTIRYDNRETVTRRKLLPYQTDLTEHIYQHAQSLLQSNWAEDRLLRLIGITMSDFQRKGELSQVGLQTDLFHALEQQAEFEHDARLEKLTQVTDALRNRFGEDILIKGRMLQPDDSNALRDHRTRGTSLQKDRLFEEE